MNEFIQENVKFIISYSFCKKYFEMSYICLFLTNVIPL